jgi:hypothetical protein
MVDEGNGGAVVETAVRCGASNVLITEPELEPVWPLVQGSTGPTG